VGDVEMVRGENFVRPAAALQPFGYDAVFDWVLESNLRRKRQRVMRRYVAPLVVLVFAFVLGMFLQTKYAAKIVPDMSKDLEARVAAANSAWFGVGDAADSMVADELGKMRERYEALESAVELDALRGRLEILKRLKHTSRRRDIAEFERVLGEADRKLSYQRIMGMSPEDPDLKAASEAFLKRFPGAAEVNEVAGILSAIRGKQDQNDREKVRRVTVVNGDRESLNRKAAAIMEYVIAHPEVEQAQEMRRAAEASRRLASSDTLKVRLSAAGVFKHARKFRVSVFVNGSVVQQLESDGKVTRATWDEVFELHGWVPGARVEVKAWDLRFLNELVGARVDTDSLSVKLLGGKNALENDPGFGGHYMEGGHFEFRSEIEGYGDEDWAALAKFVAPGLVW
jgi:hypothetical protein